MFSRLVWNTWAQLIFLPLPSLILELQIHAILLCICVLLGTGTQKASSMQATKYTFSAIIIIFLHVFVGECVYSSCGYM